jgi:hypothetical protein
MGREICVCASNNLFFGSVFFTHLSYDYLESTRNCFLLSVEKKTKKNKETCPCNRLFFSFSLSLSFSSFRQCGVWLPCVSGKYSMRHGKQSFYKFCFVWGGRDRERERVCVCACIVDIEHTVACVVMVQVGLSFGWFGVYKSHTHTKDWTHARMDRHKISRANIFLLGYQRLKRIVCLAISSLLYAQARLKAAAQKTQIQTGLVYTLALTPGRYTYRETEKNQEV